MGASEEIVYVIGDVDQDKAAELEDVLERMLVLSRPIVVDLTRCRYIGSAGLRTLLRTQRRAAQFTTLVTAQSVAARLLEIAKVEERLGVRHLTPVNAVSLHTDEERDFIRVITLEGEWDLSRGNELRRHIERAVAHPRVVLDLSRVSYVDSHCVGMLVRMRTQRVAKGYEPSRLVLPGGNVNKILGLLGAYTLWSVCDSLDQALADWKHPGNISVADLT